MGVEAKIIKALSTQNAVLNKTNTDLGSALTEVQQQLAILSQQIAAGSANAKDADDVEAEQTAAAALKLDPTTGDPLPA